MPHRSHYLNIYGAVVDDIHPQYKQYEVFRKRWHNKLSYIPSDEIQLYIYMIWILFRINVAVYIYIYIYMIWILFQINVAVFRGIPSLIKYNVLTNSYIICWLAISLAFITYGKPICCGLTPLTEELTSIHHITITLQDTFGVMVQMSQRTWF